MAAEMEILPAEAWPGRPDYPEPETRVDWFAVARGLRAGQVVAIASHQPRSVSSNLTRSHGFRAGQVEATWRGDVLYIRLRPEE